MALSPEELQIRSGVMMNVFKNEEFKAQMKAALPMHMPVDRMLQLAIMSISKTPKLLECTKNSVLASLMTAARLGLAPDGVGGQGYLVPYGDQCQFIPGYKGLITLARQSGEVVSISAHEVYKNDLFEFEFGADEKLRHVPFMGNGPRFMVDPDPKDRQKDEQPICFYAVAKLKDGGVQIEVMSLWDVLQIRNKSQGYRSWLAFGKGKGHETPWVHHFPQMGRKTLIRRIANYLPMSVQKAAEIDALADAGRIATINAFGDIEVEGEVDPETGEVMEPVDPAAAKMDAAAGAGAPAGEQQQEGGKKPRATRTTRPQNAPTAEQKAAAADVDQQGNVAGNAQAAPGGAAAGGDDRGPPVEHPHEQPAPRQQTTAPTPDPAQAEDEDEDMPKFGGD